jgi:hypothetical protein
MYQTVVPEHIFLYEIGEISLFFKKNVLDKQVATVIHQTSRLLQIIFLLPLMRVDSKIKALYNYCLCSVLNIQVACAGKRLSILFLFR